VTNTAARIVFSPALQTVVTGATGFLGRNVVAVSGQSDWRPLEISDMPVDAVIIHLGANVSGTQESLAENVSLDQKMIDVSRERNARLIYASTNNVYAHALECSPLDRVSPVGPYAIAKCAGEMAINSSLGASADICRFADVFGVGQRHGNFFRAIEAAVADLTELQQVGAGAKRRTYIHVQDAARVLLWLARQRPDADTGHSRVWNVGYPDSATVAEILRLVADESGLPLRQQHLDDDESWKDMRTMKVARFPERVMQWASFREALADHVRDLMTTTTSEGKR
jgi:nucleoside-diphosphate-sugar epimerase